MNTDFAGKTAEGIIEIADTGYGFVNLHDDRGPIYLSLSLIEWYSLNTGDTVRCTWRSPKEKERYRAAVDIENINGVRPLKIHEMDVEIYEDYYLYHLGDIIIKTDDWKRKGVDSVLGIGGDRRTKAPMLMNYMMNHPEILRGKHVFEPFAGAGPYGFLALKLGAKHCDLLDVNPRAIQFMNHTATLNDFDSTTYTIVQNDIETFQPLSSYDLIFANPPFVPTPPSLTGVLHSNGGDDGCRLTRILLSRLDNLLQPEGMAFIISLQIETVSGPLLVHDIDNLGLSRPVEMMRYSDCSVDFQLFVEKIMVGQPTQRDAIVSWHDDLQERYGAELKINWYIIHVGKKGFLRPECIITSFQEERYGKAYAPKRVNPEKRVQTLVDLEIFR
ncbi:methyltransferase [Candidatus Bathyarchaeota archaeon]|nr:methyltransferase [Candidatus Bathyarchaeota archaeon]